MSFDTIIALLIEIITTRIFMNLDQLKYMHLEMTAFYDNQTANR